METKTKDGSGNLSYFGELVAGGTVLKRIRENKIFKVEDIPKNPFVIKVDVGGNVPVAPYVHVNFSVSLTAPVDIKQIPIDEAYIEAYNTVLAVASSVSDELKKGIFLKEKPNEPKEE